VTLLLGLFLAPYLHYQDTLVAFLPGVFGYDFARSRRPKLLRVFRVLILVAMFGPAALFVTRYNRPLGWVWPLPLIMILAAVCALALRRQKRDPDEN
jgi:peptidoglycan/LPS O-acetylase OafA/YrhL